MLPLRVSELGLEPAKAKKPSKEELFAFQVRAYRLPRVERQYRFAQEIGRQWRFDFAFPEYFVAVEIEGLVVIGKGKDARLGLGRHHSVAGIKEDMAKYNTAALLGWLVLRFEQCEVKPGRAIAFTQRVLQARGWRSA